MSIPPQDTDDTGFQGRQSGQVGAEGETTAVAGAFTRCADGTREASESAVSGVFGAHLPVGRRM